ncbi:hypothetical protein A3A21_03465 [Candidatus Jorgensenbacteria bacterium RIFCSPLOWO2_01_FULL_45_25b]|uniref:Glycosidase n=1 Tax=Candidatus Jorgensenbacteria bacterium RIFCSPLOWO2_01_FULL_45_25b TaxID=1798471 RepID=A0A1F6BYN2_9BACT|nr:MAG: hypothetical protein A3A21_03465 [Candidatus Jorgensenbacteria bacterium RIFCSPLOWO2_01_FULL_45_25b]
MGQVHEKLARILRTDKDTIINIDKRLSEVTGKKGIIEKIISEKERRIAEHLQIFGLSPAASPRDVFQSLIKKVEADEEFLKVVFGNPDSSRPEGLARILEIIRGVVGPTKGFFLKEEKAREFLTKEPPKKVMEYLGYSSSEAMLGKENLFEVYSALRFVEDSEWMNGVFFKQYEALTPDDFEEREIRLQVLDIKWLRSAEHFLTHKLHNISHLKEMGVVFVIPATFGISGEILRMTSLIFHYLSEVPYYSDMFRRIAKMPTGEKSSFGSNLISLLRGDVIDRNPSDNNFEGGRMFWLVIQRYLAKDDQNDWRLFVPHINPEAIHWLRAEEHLVEVGKKFQGVSRGLDFWLNMDWVGDFFRDDDGNDILISFDLVDTVMSLVKKKEHIKFLYHHEEALWNKIFMEYFGREKLVAYSQEHLLKGYVEI